MCGRSLFGNREILGLAGEHLRSASGKQCGRVRSQSTRISNLLIFQTRREVEYYVESSVAPVMRTF